MSESDQLVLRAKNLVVGYATKAVEKIVLSNVQLELKAGECVGLLGANGKGKTTLLKTLAGLQEPLSGEIFINGKALKQMSTQERAKQLSVVLTMMPLTGSVTAYELVCHGRQPYTDWSGKLSEKDKSIVCNALERVNALAFADRDVRELSDGERQRVLVARALAQETPIILLDEPTSYLDIIGRAELVRLLRNLAKELGITILLTSHDLALLVNTVDRCLLIEGEDKLISGNPKELLSEGVFSRIFSGEGVSLDRETGALIID